MSSQSASTRTASQATVNAYVPPAPLEREAEPTTVSPWWLVIPAAVVGWFGVPALVEVVTQLLN